MTRAHIVIPEAEKDKWALKVHPTDSNWLRECSAVMENWKVGDICSVSSYVIERLKIKYNISMYECPIDGRCPINEDGRILLPNAEVWKEKCFIYLGSVRLVPVNESGEKVIVGVRYFNLTSPPEPENIFYYRHPFLPAGVPFFLVGEKVMAFTGDPSRICIQKSK